ncbi:hypothetical protein EYC84_005704 [Monilinia fructicola]|uniref:Uncharacterized protein n=1 Tax=Monilinia fructicola TaxID=38448 RepID=A0A5M9JY90_MONFR|nr:hypothetical protein EYC84_005704 [Monilinia fructicola]
MVSSKPTSGFLTQPFYMVHLFIFYAAWVGLGCIFRAASSNNRLPFSLSNQSILQIMEHLTAGTFPFLCFHWLSVHHGARG